MNAGRGNRTAQSRRYKEKHRVEYYAHAKVYVAVKQGKLKKPTVCSMCGKSGLMMGHHNDYSKPLDVIWVCWECHNNIHKV
jgi:ribosomal protein S27AE